MIKNPQRSLNTRYNVARDGAAKNTPDTIAPAHGMKNRIAEHSLLPGFSNPLDDEKELPLKAGQTGKPAPIHRSTPSRAQRGQHVEGQAADVLANAARLGKDVADKVKQAPLKYADT
jgi:hypothetical protein